MCPTGADSMNLSEQFFDESMRSHYNMREASIQSELALYEENSLRSNSMPAEQDCESKVAVLETLQEIDEEPPTGKIEAASKAEPSKAEPSKAEPVGKPSKAEPNKKKIVAPPMHYILRNAPADVVYHHLRELTKHSAVARDYVRVIAPALYAQRNPIVFGYIPAPPLVEITKQVIGEEGYFFKLTTAVCGVYFIWHDRDTNVFLFWGSSTFKVVKAMNSIRWRIFKCCDLYGANAVEANAVEANAVEANAVDEYADMPGLISCGNSPDYEHPEPC
jgi:hypothetical protein